MTEPKDPERLLTDALRARAVLAPQPDRTADTSPRVTSRLGAPHENAPASLPPQYGLISGAGADSLERERAALDSAPVASPDPPTVRQPPITRQPTASAPLPVYWVLLLAVLLGLAAGSVVGLLTIL
jgi:hypothetical protein